MADLNELFDVFDRPSTSKNDDEKKIQKDSESTKEALVADFLNQVLEDESAGDEEPRKRRKIDVLEDVNIDNLTSRRIQVHTVDTIEACLHEVALPPNVEYMPLRHSQAPPAKDYTFTLDPFQKEAILCLENDQSVLVSAHTSAGKTVVAEYAIAMSLQNKRRVIYTTPIKALSNQKYREFFEDFQDVGLLTGDATINPTASCLIMTTEILRSMLYRGSDLMREVNWVIFDEIHYMRDKERGVVWEETIILLPDNVHYVFLSATIPNASQFAQWICHLHHQPCHVVYTDYRPVPLQQYIFPAGASGLYLVVDEHGNFREKLFEEAMDALQLTSGSSASKGPQRGRRGGVKNDGNCYKIVKMIMEQNFAPVIVFSFSKKECEAYALAMAKMDFNTDEEKDCVSLIFNNAIDVLSEEDKQLPQVSAVLPLLRKGIGIHHSGLLPVLKETIEILFAEGLIKALFATETFAMGLNMPARTVLFTSVRKFDGKDFRCVTSGEYIQMSGRAGRRGLDEKGIVILMIDEKMTPSVVKEIVKGLPDPINSAFHLTYDMILNLLRVDDINPEFMLEKSFFQFQNYAAIPGFCEKLKLLNDQYNSIQLEDEENISSYCKIQERLTSLHGDIQEYIVMPQHCLPFIQPGRMAKINNKVHDFSWGIIVDLEQRKIDPNSERHTSIVKVLLHVSKQSAENPNQAMTKPPKENEKGEMMVVPVKLDSIQQLSSVRVFLPQDLTKQDNMKRVKSQIEAVLTRFPDGVPLLDPVTDMGINDKELVNLVEAKRAFEQRLKQHPLRNHSELKKLQRVFSKKASIEAEIKEVKGQIKAAKSLLQMEELKCRKRVLRRLKFCTPADVIEVKGRVACEISSADALLLTELIFTGTLEELTVHQLTALLSCFVFQEKSNDMAKLTEELSGPLRIMQDIARRIARVSKESKLEIDEETYIESFKPHLMDVVYAWSKGASFASICKVTDIFEGSIIRCFRRLEELLRQMCQASKALGNNEMEQRFSLAIKNIKRDIVFAPSLYL